MHEGDLEGNLITVIGGSEGKDLLLEAAEFSLDALIDDGVVKDIPFVGTVAKLYGIAVRAQGYIFTKKVRQFLTELATIPKAEREQFARRLKRHPEERERTADALLTMLDKLDDMAKAPMLARAFSRYIQDEFDFPTFRRLAVAIDRCLVHDLRELDKLEEKPVELEGYIGDLLVSAGVVRLCGMHSIGGGRSKKTYALSELGELFLQVVVRGQSCRG